MKWGSMGGGVACFITMLISGIGLVSQSNWGRILALTNAWLMIPFFLGSGIYDIAIQAPAASRFLQANPMMRDMGGLMWMEIVVQIVIYILLIVYAVITICMLMSGRVRDFFQHRSFDHQFYDDDWDDRPRSRGRQEWGDY